MDGTLNILVYIYDVKNKILNVWKFINWHTIYSLWHTVQYYMWVSPFLLRPHVFNSLSL